MRVPLFLCYPWKTTGVIGTVTSLPEVYVEAVVSMLTLQFAVGYLPELQKKNVKSEYKEFFQVMIRKACSCNATLASNII